MIVKENSFIQLFEKCLGVFSFGLVLFPKLVPVFFILLISVIVFGFIKNEVKFKLNTVGVLFILFYFAYLVGVIYTHNEVQAMKYVENKLSFIILPILFSLNFKVKWSLNWLYTGFVFGVVVASIYSVIYGLLHNGQVYPDGITATLTSSFISPLHHPTYFSAYILICIIILFIGWKEKIRFFSLYWIIPFTIFSLLLQGFLLSLSGILFLLMTIILAFIYYIKMKFGKIVFYISIVALPLMGFFTIKMIPSLEGEWGAAEGYAEIYLNSPETFVESRVYPMSGSEVRIVMWTASAKTIRNFPFGVGTGNVDEYLGKELIRLKQDKLVHHNYNPHNQFFQTGVEIGIFGMFILFSIIVTSFYYGYKFKNWLLIIITGSLFFNSLFESMLQNRSGIVFYTFWICLLVLHIKNNHSRTVVKRLSH